MTNADVAQPSRGGGVLPSLAGSLLAIGLTTLVCSALLALALTPFTALLGLGLGLGPPVALAALSSLKPRLLLAVTAYPMIGAGVAAAAHVLFLYGVDHSHDLRTAAAVLVVWLLLAGAFATAFKMACSGKYRQAAWRSMQVALGVLVLAALWLVAGSAFDGGGSIGSPSDDAGALAGQLASICFLTGILIAPLTLLHQCRRQVTRGKSS